MTTEDMHTVEIDRPVSVIALPEDCFSAPCFNIELRDRKGSLIATVSDVMVAMDGIPRVYDHDLAARMDRERLGAVGTVSDYRPDPFLGTMGRRFTITAVR